jgi:hypothetical protein
VKMRVAHRCTGILVSPAGIVVSDRLLRLIWHILTVYEASGRLGMDAPGVSDPGETSVAHR